MEFSSLGLSALLSRSGAQQWGATLQILLVLAAAPGNHSEPNKAEGSQLSGQRALLIASIPHKGLAGCFEFSFLTNTSLPSLLGCPVPWMRSCPWAVLCSVGGCLPDLGAGKGDSGTSKQGQSRKLSRSQGSKGGSLQVSQMSHGITREHKAMHLSVAKILGCCSGGCFVRDKNMGFLLCSPLPETQQGLETSHPTARELPLPCKVLCYQQSVFSCLQEPFPITSQQTSVNTSGADMSVSVWLVLVRLSPAPPG